MNKWILSAALMGWVGIVGFAYKLANARIDICSMYEAECIIRTTATRDNTLILGLALGLVGLIALALMLSRRAPRFPRANQGEAIRLN